MNAWTAWAVHLYRKQEAARKALAQAEEKLEGWLTMHPLVTREAFELAVREIERKGVYA